MDWLGHGSQGAAAFWQEKLSIGSTDLHTNLPAVLEAFIGTVKFFNNDGSAAILLNRYQQLEDMVFYQLMSQTHLQGLYQLVSFTQDETGLTWRGDYSLAAMAITFRAMEDLEAAAALLADFLRSVRGMNPMRCARNSRLSLKQAGGNRPSWCALQGTELV